VRSNIRKTVKSGYPLVPEVPDKPVVPQFFFTCCDTVLVKYGMIFSVACHRFSVQELYNKPLLNAEVRFFENDINKYVFNTFSAKD
jgi:hypothetical protein